MAGPAQDGGERRERNIPSVLNSQLMNDSKR